MSLAHGRHSLSIPGPSMIPDRVLGAMHRASPNIYEGPLIELTDRVYARLATVARTSGKVAVYLSNGHGAWEAALVNTLSRGDKVLVLATGRFAIGWGDMATGLGIRIETLDFGAQDPVDPQRLEDVLRADGAHEIAAVLTVQTDTASSVKNDIVAVRNAMTAAKHPALLMVDCIASLACDRYDMDRWGVDVTVAACQKGLMTPPGLGFNLVSENALARRASADLVTPYWDWKPRLTPEMYYQRFAGTAPTHHLFGLDEALTMIVDEEGLEGVWNRHQVLSEAVHAAVDRWSQDGALYLNIAEPDARSTAVTTVRCPGVDAGAIRAYCEHHLGVTLGIGLGLGGPKAGGYETHVFRIGHMGHLNPPMILGTLSAIDLALKALSIPHGSGAIDAATRVIADRLADRKLSEAGKTRPAAAE